MSRAVRSVKPASPTPKRTSSRLRTAFLKLQQLAVKLRREVRVDKKKPFNLDAADVQGLQAGAVAQLLESCKKAQQKAVAIHSKRLYCGGLRAALTLVPHPLCVNTLTVLSLCSQGRQKREKRGARKGRGKQTMDQGHTNSYSWVACIYSHIYIDRYKECDQIHGMVSARRRPRGYTFPSNTRQSLPLSSSLLHMVRFRAFRLLRELTHANPLDVSCLQS